jgi:tetratricopeptide (TPR) repeat protein
MGYFIDAITPSSTSGLHDARGMPCSTANRAAIDRLEPALEAMLSYFGDPLALLDAAIEADPAWAHPHVLKASLLLTLAEHGPALQAREILASLPAGPANEREQAHAAAAHAAAQGQWEAACDAWEAILVRWPRDIAALLFAHLFDFYRGDALNLKRRPQRVLPRWSADLPFYGYVLGMLAFGLEESGHYAEAEEAGRAALAINPRDPWAVHAVTHVFEMQGRHAEGARWLESRRADWAVDNGFAFHNWFHAALFQLEAMDTAGALDTFDAQLAPATDMALQRVDGTAMLWRLKLLGADVAPRFDALRRFWETQQPAAGFYAFNDVHALMALIGSGGGAELREARASVEAALAQAARGGEGSNRRMSADVGVPVAQALLAHAEERWSDAASLLLQVRDRAHGFGGSHAQRDVLTMTLLDAAVRSGHRELARHLLGERLPHKAATPLTAWWEQRIGAIG